MNLNIMLSVTPFVLCECHGIFDNSAEFTTTAVRECLH